MALVSHQLIVAVCSPLPAVELVVVVMVMGQAAVLAVAEQVEVLFAE